jgi:hypothetical protein
LGKKKAMGILNGFAMPFLRRKDACIGNVEKILELFPSLKLAKIGKKRTWVKVLESVFKKQVL